MKKVLCIAMTALLMLTAACSDKKAKVRGANDFAIEGTITGAADKTMFLQLVTPEEVKTIDSVKLDDEGRFAFYSERPKSPEIYRLSLGNQYIYLSIDSIETLTVTASFPKLEGYTVKGSDDCLKLKELNRKHAELQKQACEIEMSETLFPGQIRDSILHVIKAYKNDVAKNYILPAPNKAYAYYALFQTLQLVSGNRMLIYSPNSAEDLWAFGSVATSWSVFYPETERAKKLEKLTLDGRNALRRKNQPIDQSKIVETGLFDIELPDTQGTTRKLTDLIGKVVVLNFNDFHAAESGAVVLTLRELYTQYHDQGLEIFQIGVSQDAHWWRQSVDKLPWINVLDETGYYANLYNVQTLGEYFIIDRNNMLQMRVNNPQDLAAEVAKLCTH